MNVLGLSKDAIHLYLGLAVFFLSVIILKKGKVDLLSVIPVFLLAIAMESRDLYDNYQHMDSMFWSYSLHDIINTLFWPLTIVALEKIRVMCKKHN